MGKQLWEISMRLLGVRVGVLGKETESGGPGYLGVNEGIRPLRFPQPQINPGKPKSRQGKSKVSGTHIVLTVSEYPVILHQVPFNLAQGAGKDRLVPCDEAI